MYPIMLNLLIFTSLHLISPASAATPPPTMHSGNEITVTLFGQPCLLSGPIDNIALKAIHSISPEQVFIPEYPSLEVVQKALGKIKIANSVPAGLDRYKDRLRRRLEAQISFLTGIAGAKKEMKSTPLLSATQPHIAPSRRSEFALQLKKIDSLKKWDSELQNKLWDQFNDLIEPNPEEEFHKSIQRLKIHYTCEFSDEADGEEE